MENETKGAGPDSKVQGQRLTPLADLLSKLEQQRPAIEVDEIVTRRREVVLSSEALRRAAAYFAKKGLHSPVSLVEMRLKGDDLSAAAKEAGIDVDELHALVNRIADTTPAAELSRLKRDAATPKATGHIDWTDPRVRADYERRGIKPVEPLSKADFEKVRFRDLLPYRIPRGPKKAVDLRPFLGDARDQNPRGTCAVFAAVAVAEAFEYFRDKRAGHIDLAEQFLWWYRDGGQRYSAGGYDCGAALDDIREIGVCEELNLPYHQVQINNNHQQVPIPDKAMDRAQFYRLGAVVGLPTGDIDAVKRVIETGRCVVYASNLDGWNTGTGEIAMPPAGTLPGGSHCTSIVGYIDDDSLAPELEGGYFIIRNSWGGVGNPSHIFGPEYGGHLLMPYAWYRQYAGWPATTTDRNDPSTTNQWLVEYYDNRELQGAPLVALPQTVGAVDFDWGFHSPVRFTLPVLGTFDVLPIDNFSVRFSKVFRFREGFYRFHLRGNDGLRLYVDDQLVINQWKDQPSTPYTAVHHVSGGDHIVRVEYYEAGGAADVHLTVEPVQWRYELFSSEPSGLPIAIFDDTITELEWRHAPPVPPGPGRTWGPFGLRGIARISFEGGTYRFHARHSGRFQLYVDGVVRHDDPDGMHGSSAPIFIAAGEHEIRIEFENSSTVPAWGTGSYYKAFCEFSWSDEGWRATYYSNARAKELLGSNTLRTYLDASHVFSRTCGLAGPVRFIHTYPLDAANDLSLHFDNWEAFTTGVADWPPDFELSYFGVWIRRRVFVSEAGHYSVVLNANECFRVLVDGKEVVQNMERIAEDPYNGDIYLDAGLHDISVEYNVTEYNGRLDLDVSRVGWTVRYRAGKDLSDTGASKTVNSVPEVPDGAHDVAGDDDFSATAEREIWLPVGKYYFTLKADRGVRLTVNQKMVIDAWSDQGPNDHSGFYEHKGGSVALRIDYYHGYGAKTLQFAIANQEFYGEYYRGTTLNAVPEGSTARRVAPIAYRYEGDIDFDFGQGSYLPRVGATNFSARWMGTVNLPVGRWSIEATSDDGVRVYVDGRLLIDSWKEQGATKHARQIDLTGRSHDFKVEYFQKSGNGVCRLQYIRVI